MSDVPRLPRPLRTRLAAEPLEDRTVPSIHINEAEPNNTLATANPIPRAPGEQIIVSGRVGTPGDRDWFRLQLQAGDVVGVSLNGRGGLNAAVQLVDAAGQLRVGNDDGQGVGEAVPKESPLPRGESQSIDAKVYYVIPTVGTYFLEAAASADATAGGYDLDLMVARPGLERQPVGTRQILFLDFDGAAVNFSEFGKDAAPGTRQLSPLSRFLPAWGLTAADENAVIDLVTAKVRQKLSTYIRANGLNGDYAATGVPGQFGIDIRTSRDHADEFGRNPFVSRVVVGGTAAEAAFTGDWVGLAEDADVGNYKTDDEAVVTLDFVAGGLAAFPIAPPATVYDFVSDGIATLMVHEAGHIFGCFHTDQSAEDPFAGVPSVMDRQILTILGPDLVYGTADDQSVQFVAEAYEEQGQFRGLDDTLNTVSFGLATGKSAFVSVAALSPESAIPPATAPTAAEAGRGGAPAPRRLSVAWTPAGPTSDVGPADLVVTPDAPPRAAAPTRAGVFWSDDLLGIEPIAVRP